MILSFQKKLKHRLTAIGAGAFVNAVLQTYASGVKSANVREYLFSQLCVEGATSVLHTHGAIAVVSGLKSGVRFLGAVVCKSHSRVESAAKVGIAVQTQESEIVGHGDGDCPAYATGGAALSHFTFEFGKIIGDQIFPFGFCHILITVTFLLIK